MICEECGKEGCACICQAAVSDSLDLLVRVASALSNFEYIMKQPRMDSDKKHWQAIEAIQGVYDHKTAKQFRVLMLQLKGL